MFKKLRRLFCKHDYEFLRTIVEKNSYGKEDIYDIIQCKKCKKEKIIEHDVYVFFHDKNVF